MRPESTLTLLARRTTHFLYDRRIRARRGRTPRHPFPGLHETLAVHLAAALPAWALGRTTLPGLLARADRLAAVLRVLATLGYRSGGLARRAQLARRTGLVRRRARARHPDRLLAPSALAEVPLRLAWTVIGGAVALHGWMLEGVHLVLFFRRVGPPPREFDVLVDATPPPGDEPAVSTPLCTTPTVQAVAWGRRDVYRHDVPLDRLAAGDWLLSVRLVEWATGATVGGGDPGAGRIELGWVRVAGAPPSAVWTLAERG